MDIDKFVPSPASVLCPLSFDSLMDIDKFVHCLDELQRSDCFGSLMDIDKFVPLCRPYISSVCFGSLMDKIKLDLYYTLKAAILGGLFHAFITTNCEN